MQPSFDILSCHPDVFESKVSRATAVLVGELGTAAHDDLVILVEEIRRLVGGRHEIVTRKSEDDRDYPFDNVDPGNYLSACGSTPKLRGIPIPSPTRNSSSSIHVVDGVGEKSAECSSQSR